MLTAEQREKLWLAIKRLKDSAVDESHGRDDPRAFAVLKERKEAEEDLKRMINEL